MHIKTSVGFAVQYGKSSLTTVLAVGIAFLPCGRRSIGMKLVERSLLTQQTGYLAGRPVLIHNHLHYAPPQFRGLAVVARKRVTTGIAFLLGIQPYIPAVGVRITLNHTADGRRMDLYLTGDKTSTPSTL